MTNRPTKTKPTTNQPTRTRQRWRDYRTAAGGRPLDDFFATLTHDQAAEVYAGMDDVAELGLEVARHLRGDIYEVRVTSGDRKFRVLFAQDAKFILLSLSGFRKTTKKTPTDELDLAETRLSDWRRRGKKKRK